jgi:two-component system, OmpR family, heavy metal sensor histidine kinase CusS
VNRSLRSQLLVGIAATTLVGFATTAITIFFAIRGTLLHEFDGLLAAKARALATLVDQHGDEVTVQFADHPMQEFARKIQPEYYELWDADGSVLMRSRRLESGDLEFTAGSLAAPRFRFTKLPDGRPGRLVGVQFLPAVEGESLEPTAEHRKDEDDRGDQVDFAGRRRVTLVVAKETAEIDRTLARLVWMLLGVSTAAIVAMLAILGWIVKRTLRPLDELAVEIAALDERELSTRFHVSKAPQELSPVVARLNELLARLEEAFQRERVFTADVAHELRTPLAGLRATLEVALGRTRGASEYRRVIENCEIICKDTQRLVSTLLWLARMEAGRADLDRSFVNVSTYVASSWTAFESRARDRGVGVTCAGPLDVLLDTDADMLQVVFSNVFDNAVSYVNEGGVIEIEWSAGQQGLAVVIANTGCDLSEERARKVFDRFWRGDTARAATGSHAGLGLALCHKIVEALGGSIRAKVCDGRFVVTIEFGPGYVEQLSAGEPLRELWTDPKPLEDTNDEPRQPTCVASIECSRQDLR